MPFFILSLWKSALRWWLAFDLFGLFRHSQGKTVSRLEELFATPMKNYLSGEAAIKKQKSLTKSHWPNIWTIHSLLTIFHGNGYDYSCDCSCDLLHQHVHWRTLSIRPCLKWFDDHIHLFHVAQELLLAIHCKLQWLRLG